jgi:hypothetical protein
MASEGMVLRESHRRAVAGCLRRIERDLASVEHVLVSAYEGGVMLSVIDDVDDSTREALRHGIEQARGLIREAHAAFALEPEPLRKSRWVDAHFATASVLAEECESRHLLGHGEVAPEAARRFDPLHRTAWAVRLEGERRAS